MQNPLLILGNHADAIPQHGQLIAGSDFVIEIQDALARVVKRRDGETGQLVVVDVRDPDPYVAALEQAGDGLMGALHLMLGNHPPDDPRVTDAIDAWRNARARKDAP